MTKQLSISVGISIVAILVAALTTSRVSAQTTTSSSKSLNFVWGEIPKQVTKTTTITAVNVSMAPMGRVGSRNTITIVGTGTDPSCIVTVPSLAEAMELRAQLTSDRTKEVKCTSISAAGSNPTTLRVHLGGSTPSGSLEINGAP